ncbi:hypothetical protein KJS94_05630 [Flavihumibacter rivuli]|uniref:hypothetical protein n=1 Tax=Flavihumibacter rivuli TaxID=2838156 RepID=UPI001BDE1256|nr:hypothetical protein [Flavihumibacter rivuli]ULQ57679.1 hypothetical protein KJS94_05630 [Flavihumibacter rivuli]
MTNLTEAGLPTWKVFLVKLQSRNPLLYRFGWLTFAGAFICALLSLSTTTEVMGINSFIKPFKFFLSISILSFTQAWLLVYLEDQAAVKRYSKILVITMVIELVIITGQAARGRISHFNQSSYFDGALFTIMGISILVFTLWTASICWRFFRQKQFPLWMSEGYIWGIRLGLLFFVIFAFEGGQMAAILHHSMPGPDGGPGLPVLNWSTSSGDLRVPHFFGMHSLQLLPVLGYYFFPRKTSLFIIAITWLLFVLLLYWQAIKGFPLIP